MRQLVMFDIDGTLTQSTLADGVCYAQAMSEHLDMNRTGNVGERMT